MSAFGIDLQRISSRRSHYRARSPGRRRDDHRRVDGHAAGARRRKGAGGQFRLQLDRLSEAGRHAGYDRSIRPDRFRTQRRRRIHVLDLRGRRDRADRDRGASRLCSRPCLASGCSRSPRRRTRNSPAAIMRAFRSGFLPWRCGPAGSRSSLPSPCSARRSLECASFRSNSFRRLIAPNCWWTCSCPRMRRSMRRGTPRPDSTRFSRTIRTSIIGAPMSGRARSGSICP